MSNGMATFPDHLTPVITVFHSFMFYDYFAPTLAYQKVSSYRHFHVIFFKKETEDVNKTSTAKGQLISE